MATKPIIDINVKKLKKAERQDIKSALGLVREGIEDLLLARRIERESPRIRRRQATLVDRYKLIFLRPDKPHTYYKAGGRSFSKASAAFEAISESTKNADLKREAFRAARRSESIYKRMMFKSCELVNVMVSDKYL